jgi:hypothetical protein
MFKLARHILIFLFLLVIGCKAFGQGRPRVIFRRPPNYEQRVIRQQNSISKIEQVRENYIGQRLNLNVEQSQRFWPTYRRYQDALKEVRRLKRINNSKEQANGAEQIRKELYYEGELVNIRKFYTDEFLKILPPDKVSEIFKSEREFTDELIKQLAERNPPAKN